MANPSAAQYFDTIQKAQDIKKAQDALRGIPQNVPSGTGYTYDSSGNVTGWTGPDPVAYYNAQKAYQQGLQMSTKGGVVSYGIGYGPQPVAKVSQVSVSKPVNPFQATPTTEAAIRQQAADIYYGSTPSQQAGAQAATLFSAHGSELIGSYIGRAFNQPWKTPEQVVVEYGTELRGIATSSSMEQSFFAGKNILFNPVVMTAGASVLGAVSATPAISVALKELAIPSFALGAAFSASWGYGVGENIRKGEYAKATGDVIGGIAMMGSGIAGGKAQQSYQAKEILGSSKITVGEHDVVSISSAERPSTKSITNIRTLIEPSAQMQERYGVGPRVYDDIGFFQTQKATPELTQGIEFAGGMGGERVTGSFVQDVGEVSVSNIPVREFTAAGRTAMPTGKVSLTAAKLSSADIGAETRIFGVVKAEGVPTAEYGGVFRNPMKAGLDYYGTEPQGGLSLSRETVKPMPDVGNIGSTIIKAKTAFVKEINVPKVSPMIVKGSAISLESQKLPSSTSLKLETSTKQATERIVGMEVKPIMAQELERLNIQTPEQKIVPSLSSLTGTIEGLQLKIAQQAKETAETAQPSPSFISFPTTTPPTRGTIFPSLGFGGGGGEKGRGIAGGKRKVRYVPTVVGLLSGRSIRREPMEVGVQTAGIRYPVKPKSRLEGAGERARKALHFGKKGWISRVVGI